MTAHIQEFFTSRNNGITSVQYIGHEGRLWYDPVTNSIRVYDGNLGGQQVAGGGGGNTTNPTVGRGGNGGPGYVLIMTW